MGYQVPPGISDAVVPNPIFNLTPARDSGRGQQLDQHELGPAGDGESDHPGPYSGTMPQRGVRRRSSITSRPALL